MTDSGSMVRATVSGVGGAIALSAALSVTLSTPAVAASNWQFDQLFIYGDSISDSGNTCPILPLLGIVEDSCFQNRFSNGPVWVEYLANSLGIAQPTTVTSLLAGLPPSPGGVNFAFGGAFTAGGSVLLPPPISLPFPPSLVEQAGFFGLLQAGTPGFVSPNALHIILAGGNDYLLGGVQNPAGPVGNIGQTINTLYNAGARNFLVSNLPNLGELPLGNLIPPNIPPELVRAGLNGLTAAHNQGLAQLLAQLQQKPGIHLTPFDLNAVVVDVLANSATFGFTDTQNFCIKGGVPTPNLPDCKGFLFFDEIHPTTQAHGIIASRALAAVPEPGAIAAFGLLGVSFLLRGMKKGGRKAEVGTLKSEG